MGTILTPLTPSIYQYLQDVSLRESDASRALRVATNEQVEQSKMATTPEQTQLIAFLLKLIQAKRAIEVGIFTGYCSLAIAQALPDDGELIACDVNEEWVKVGKPFWAQAQVEQKIDVRIAPALDTLQSLLEEGQAHTFDFIFIDADKAHYDDYYEHALKLIRKGGLIAIDNVLWCGTDVIAEQQSPAAKSIHALNTKLQQDCRVQITLVPIAEGMTLLTTV